MHFSEEQVDKNRKRPEDQIVHPPDLGWDVLLIRHRAWFALAVGLPVASPRR